ncbi:hypothetical protein D6D23_01144 [Aureobasidium pullulans]|uniref:Vacuolar import and degradation protein 21 n=1 Tax=Aureobasidium pullulans TaxID=5580 RepID=A0A4S9FAJ2_AURPU|nr:hypothetical protein D6D23_01144 [Aureobasidium pullulans]THX44795.1 hypothetical protein D6D10_00120 [Aureobasidium pullulans]
MSLAQLRDGPLTERNTAKAASLTKRAARLRALNQITQSITQQCGLSPALNLDYDSLPSPPHTPSEDALLAAADLTRGLRFQDSLLPCSLDAIEQNPAIQALAIRNTPASTGLGISNEQAHESASINDSDAITNSPKTLDHHAAAQSSRDAGPVNPPGRESQRHRPRTVHLPPKEVQEERFREKQLRQEARRRDAAEVEKPQPEAASSPTSTIGAPSMTTPLPTGPSPLTSTDEDVASSSQTVPKPTSLQPSLQEALAKEQHDKLLQSQKEIAYREALGHDDDSPDVQLRLEQEQAAKATRDATMNAKPTDVKLTEAIDTTVAARDAARIAASLSHSASPSDSASDASHKKRAPRPSLVNIMPPRDPALANAVVETSTVVTAPPAARTQSTSELNESTRPTLFGSKRAHTTGDVLKVKTEPSVSKRQQRPVQEQPQSPISLRCSALLKSEGYNALKGASAELSKDYLEPLYRIQVHEPPNGRPLHELLQKASKVVTTTEQFAGYHERQDQRILRRIYQLQNANRWSLRQMEPCAEPAAPKIHMDHLMAEMKWMRTDFRQERKIKRATAKYLAEQCADWVMADGETRQSMQIRVKSLEALRQDTVAPHSPAESSIANGDRHSQGAKSPPGLDNDIESGLEDFDMPLTPQHATVVPSSFFSAINMDKETFHLQDSEALHNALAELPLLRPFEEDNTPVNSIIKHSTPAVSKFCTAKMMIEVGGPSRKRSRYDYSDEDESMDESSLPVSKRLRASHDDSGLQPEQTDVALFEPENKLLRSRLHQNTAFRPPSEFQMPSSQFYEFRTASQWTEEDQQALRRLAKEYSFNWSLIADSLSLPSKFNSATDRRTPWECFERWVELESLPNEMRKTLYFKTWNQRLEGANRNNEAKYQAQLAQLAQTPGQPPAIMRKKTTPLKVDKRRQNRYLHMVDAMRKLARKREQQAHKQSEAQKAAHMRKQHENAAPKNGIPTPQEFSKLRQERDVQIAARQERYREQMLRQAQMQRNGQMPNQQPLPNANAHNRPGQTPQGQPGAPQQVNHQGLPNGQHSNAAAQSGAHINTPQMGMRGAIPQAQMQPNMRPVGNGQANGTPESMQQRVLETQKAHQLKMGAQQYQMAPPNRSSPGGMHPPNGVMGSQPAMNGMQNVRTPGQQVHNHQSTSNSNATGSPHMPPPPTPSSQSQQPQQLASGNTIASISHGLQLQFPQASVEKIQEMANERLRQIHYGQQQQQQPQQQQQQQQQSHQQARQSALSAAAGSHAVNSVPNGPPAYSQNQAAFHQNNGNGNAQQYNNGSNTPGTPANPNAQQYAANMRQRTLAQQNQIQHQNQNTHGQNHSSPRVAQANSVPGMVAPSPNMTPAHPSQNIPSNSRTPTPQMSRMGSGQGVVASSVTPQPVQQQQTPSAMQHQSPVMQQASPRPVSAGTARQ